jgi:hypothetical protein
LSWARQIISCSTIVRRRVKGQIAHPLFPTCLKPDGERGHRPTIDLRGERRVPPSVAPRRRPLQERPPRAGPDRLCSRVIPVNPAHRVTDAQAAGGSPALAGHQSVAEVPVLGAARILTREVVEIDPKAEVPPDDLAAIPARHRISPRPCRRPEPLQRPEQSAVLLNEIAADRRVALDHPRSLCDEPTVRKVRRSGGCAACERRKRAHESCRRSNHTSP